MTVRRPAKALNDSDDSLRLPHTGVTRRRKLVVIVGQPKALALAVNNVRATRRLTDLAMRLARAALDDPRALLHKGRATQSPSHQYPALRLVTLQLHA